MKRSVSHRLALALVGLAAFVCLGPCAKRAEAASAVLAKDGKSYTSTAMGTNAKGEKIKTVLVMEKQ